VLASVQACVQEDAAKSQLQAAVAAAAAATTTTTTSDNDGDRNSNESGCNSIPYSNTKRGEQQQRHKERTSGGVAAAAAAAAVAAAAARTVGIELLEVLLELFDEGVLVLARHKHVVGGDARLPCVGRPLPPGLWLLLLHTRTRTRTHARTHTRNSNARTVVLRVSRCVCVGGGSRGRSFVRAHARRHACTRART
jgi:hypothetical protein